MKKIFLTVCILGALCVQTGCDQIGNRASTLQTVREQQIVDSVRQAVAAEVLQQKQSEMLDNKMEREMEQKAADSYQHRVQAFLAGNDYWGPGNRSGIGTEIYVEFQKNGICQCSSKWYGEYLEDHTFQGTYKVVDNKVVLSCHGHTYTFWISEGFRVLVHDKSVYDSGGSMDNDFQVLYHQGNIRKAWPKNRK